LKGVLKREIELSKTLTGQMVNSKRPSIICTYQKMLEKIFGENTKITKAEIFAYHCQIDCNNGYCKEKELLTL